MRYASQHRAETRARLLRSAARAAKRSGLMAASIDGIAADAGISGGGVYHHFTSKQVKHLILLDPQRSNQANARISMS